MTKKIYLLLAGIVIIILAAFSIYFFSNRNQSVAGINDKVINLGYTNTISSLGAFIAQEKGYFKDQGIQVKMTQFQSSNEIINALVKGEADAGCCSGITAAFDVNQTSPGKIKLYSLSNDSRKKEWDQIIVKQDSTIQTPKDFEGKKVGVYPGSNATPIFKEYLNLKSVDVSKVELVQLPVSNQLPALESGSIDALWAYEPTATIALNKGQYRILDKSIYATVNPKTNMAAGYISTDFTIKYPELAKKFVRAMDQANTFAQNNPAEASKLQIKYTGIDPILAPKVKFIDYGTNAQAEPENLQYTADFLAQIGIIKQKIEVKDLIYKI